MLDYAGGEEIDLAQGIRHVGAGPTGGPPWVDRWRRLHWVLPKKLKECRANVVFSLSGYVTHQLRRVSGTICTVNNMLPFSPVILGEYPRSYRLKLRVQRNLLVRSLHWADSVLLHSHHALATISRYAGDISAKTRVVLTGVPSHAMLDPEAPPPHPFGGQPYCFYLSAIKRYKNHVNLVEAYRRLEGKSAEIPELIIAGYPTDSDYLADILAAVRKAGLQQRVRYLGTLPREELMGWLHHATINIFASGCETNSVVLAEILGASGVLACSDVPPMPEVVGHAAEFFHTDDPDSIAQVVLKLCRNHQRRRELRELSAERSRQLSWEECGKVVWGSARAAADAFERRTRVR